MMKAINNKKLPKLPTKTVGKVNKTQITECEFEWSIPDFLSLPGRSGECFSSPSFSFADESWHLRIYPNVVKAYEVGYIGVYLARDSSGQPVTLEFSLGLKDLDGKKVEDRSYLDVFEVTEEFGEPKMISRAEFLERKSKLLFSDTLTVLCTMTYSIQEPSEACTLESSSFLPKNQVLHDLKQLFLKKEDCDVIINVKGKEFTAHKAILTARSPVFASTLRCDMKDKANGIINIEDCDLSCFSDFLCFLYCGTLENLSKENVFSLFSAADKYDVQDLRTKCLEFMKENLSIETFCDTVTMAMQHSESDLISLTTNFFIKNVPQIIVTVKWKRFLTDYPILANELLIKHLKSSNV